jgi:hypothetical protein
VAIQCSFCGSPLKDDARYCNQCGTLDASHPFSPKSSSAAAATVGESNKTSGDRREQIAQQPPARSSRRLAQDEPPSWMSHLENGPRNKVPSGGLESGQQEKPREDTKASKQVRELRVKVWEQEEPGMPAVNGRITEDDLEDLPTRPLVAGSPEIHKQRNAPSSTPGKAHQARTDEVEYLDTVPLATQEGTRPKNTPLPIEETKQRQERLSQQHFDTSNRSRYQSFSAPTPTYPRQESRFEEQRPAISTAPLAEEWRQTPPSQSAVPSTQRTGRRKGRKLPLIMPVLLIVLVVSGVLGTWIFVYHPFSVPGITQPQQSFSNTQLGLSLNYPSGWQSQVDVGKATVHFHDTSHTAEVDIVVASAPTGSPGAYLQQKANQLGMTGLQSSSTSFGGASWQQIRGNVLVKGASYTETLLATIHKNNVFTMMLLAPQTTYVQEDQMVFSKIRASFQFLS